MMQTLVLQLLSWNRRTCAASAAPPGSAQAATVAAASRPLNICTGKTLHRQLRAGRLSGGQKRRVLRLDDKDDGGTATTWAARIQRRVGQRSAESRLRHLRAKSLTLPSFAFPPLCEVRKVCLAGALAARASREDRRATRSATSMVRILSVTRPS